MAVQASVVMARQPRALSPGQPSASVVVGQGEGWEEQPNCPHSGRLSATVNSGAHVPSEKCRGALIGAPTSRVKLEKPIKER
ncbi:UNVERIFIED_CONTAM: hypothetical protein K2H54_045989 [Gekko kuhli]